MALVAHAAVSHVVTEQRMHPPRPSWASLQGLVLVLFLAYVIGDIFQVFPSGNPQPSDFLMILVVGSVVTGLAFKVCESQRLLVVFALLLFWICQVNLAYYMFYGDTHFLMTNAYFLFNVSVFISVNTLCLYFGVMFIRSLRFALLLALIVEVVAVIAISSEVAPHEPGFYRSIGTFQDPNQLAYWAILTLCSLLVLKPQEGLGGIEIAGMAATIYLVLSSLSRSGTLGLVIVLLVALSRLRVRALWLAILACAAVPAIVLSWSYMRDLDAYVNEGAPAQIAARLGEDDRDDNIAGRGYERLWRFPEYIILGAGEGAYWRFRGGIAYEQTEFHSSLGNILFSYGIVGFSLFCCFMWEVFRGSPWQHRAYLLGPLAWGIFNYGFRFSTFWVFLALVYSMSIIRSESRW
jgi:hypothetical protein